MIIFSDKAYNAIIRESFDKDPKETGGILLGHILNNGIWVVMEVLPPGINCIFETAYFEYDDAFVNYLAQSVANQYKNPLQLLGLWHRHPGSMDFFSSTDDQTNATFANQNQFGVISGLVNIDPTFRLTMYHMPHQMSLGSRKRPAYEKIHIEVGNDIIPEDYFKLRYFDGAGSNPHPKVERPKREEQFSNGNSDFGDSNDDSNTREDNNNSVHSTAENQIEEAALSTIRFFRRNWYLLILLLLIIFAFSIKSSWDNFSTIKKETIEWVNNKFKKDRPSETDTETADSCAINNPKGKVKPNTTPKDTTNNQRTTVDTTKTK